MDKRLILLIFILSFVVRVFRLDYPMSGVFAWGDGTRDYLVASHIVKYQELPKVGPYNLLDNSGIKNSPLYFYLLALPLLIYNHPLTLGVVNLLLQILSLVLIYLIAKQAFGNPTALTALILFSFNPQVIEFADYIWQPYLMLPLALLAVYLFIRGHLIFSMIAASIAFFTHYSGFPYLAALLMARFKRSLKLALAAVLTLAIYFILPRQTMSGYLNNLNSNLDILLEAFYVNKLFLALLITTLLLYKCKAKTFIFIILFFLPILFASYFNKIRLHYLILAFPAFAILTASLVENIPGKPLKLLLVAILLVIFSGNLNFLKQFKTPLENQRFINRISEKVMRDLNYNTDFQVKSYALYGTIFDYPVLDSIFLVQLERNLNTKLAKTVDNSPFNHQQVKQKNQLVVVCFHFDHPTSDCREFFLKQNFAYQITKTSYTSEYISVFLAKQNLQNF